MDECHAGEKIEFNADQFYQRARVGNYVSCWTFGSKDNMTHWQLYAGVRSGIAITTTVERLVRTALSWDREVIISKVKYVDHTKVKRYAISLHSDVLQFKHEAYRNDKEVRVIVPQQGDAWKSNPIEIRLPVADLDMLVKTIVVAPEASPEFYEAVKRLCSQYGLKAPVLQSALVMVPV